MVQSRGVAPLRGKLANDMPTNIQKEVESHTSMSVYKQMVQNVIRVRYIGR
jgi:hypothetical protein